MLKNDFVIVAGNVTRRLFELLMLPIGVQNETSINGASASTYNLLRRVFVIVANTSPTSMVALPLMLGIVNEWISAFKRFVMAYRQSRAK